MRDVDILAAERAAHQRTRRRARAWFYGGVFGATGSVILFGAAPLITVSVAAWLGTVLLFLAVVACGVGLSVALARSIGNSARSQIGLASPGPWSFGQIYTKAPPDQVWPVLQQNLALQGIAVRSVGPTTIEADKPMTLTTPGTLYLIDLRPSSDRPGYGVVTIAARPRTWAAFAIHDYGISQNLVTSLLMSVPGRELPAGVGFTGPLQIAPRATPTPWRLTSSPTLDRFHADAPSGANPPPHRPLPPR